ncbi:hypothetical protein [Halomonas sp. I5-271120]|uniref:hypothetical protein n=1 Tax=Halomonas sp. I5-271120 TaxID=3061632 RepID=UPI002714DFBB|nr:hypothetical protein [Halomonas sp. I5-271120]
MRPPLETLNEHREYKRWSTALLIITLIYIIAEFAWNAALLNSASGLVLDPDEFKVVEIIGRVLGSIGCSLFVLGFVRLKPKSTPFSTSTAAARAFLVLATVGPAFFVGSNALINSFLVDSSNGKERWVAGHINLLKRAEGAGIVDILGMKLEPDDDPSDPARMTYHVMAGPALLTVPEVIEDFRQGSSIQPTIFGLVKLHTLHKRHDAYDSYLEYNDELKNLWRLYQESSTSVSDQMQRITNSEFNRVWNPIRQELRNKWPDVQRSVARSRKDADRLYDHVSAVLASKVRSHMANNPARFTVANLESADSLEDTDGYLRQITQSVYSTQPSKPYDKLNIHAMVCGGPGRAGRTCVPSQADYLRTLHDWGGYDQYVDPESGYSFDLRSYQDFLNDPLTGKRVREQIEEKTGLYISRSFDSEFRGRHAVVRRYINEAKQREVASEWRDAFADAVPGNQSFSKLLPGLPASQFFADPGVEKLIRSKSGYYSPRVRPGMSKSDFTRNVLSDVMRDEQRRLWREYQLTPSNFEGEREVYLEDLRETVELGRRERHSVIEKGEDYYRATVVPPIVLGLSLFFSLVALLKLPLMINEVVHARTQGRCDYRLVAQLVFAAGLASLLIFPIVKDRDTMSPGAQTSLAILDERAPQWSTATKWVFAAEPVFYQIGEAILQPFGLDRREPLNEYNYPQVL